VHHLATAPAVSCGPALTEPSSAQAARRDFTSRVQDRRSSSPRQTPGTPGASPARRRAMIRQMCLTCRQRDVTDRGGDGEEQRLHAGDGARAQSEIDHRMARNVQWCCCGGEGPPASASGPVIPLVLSVQSSGSKLVMCPTWPVGAACPPLDEDAGCAMAGHDGCALPRMRNCRRRSQAHPDW
jgi:hypothetical protein